MAARPPILLLPLCVVNLSTCKHEDAPGGWKHCNIDLFSHVLLMKPLTAIYTVNAIYRQYSLHRCLPYCNPNTSSIASWKSSYSVGPWLTLPLLSADGLEVHSHESTSQWLNHITRSLLVKLSKLKVAGNLCWTLHAYLPENSPHTSS